MQLPLTHALPLRGRHIALLCDAEHCDGLVPLRDAADALGAQLVHVRPHTGQLVQADQVDALGRMLGRLYDAIHCHDVPPTLVARLQMASGKPVTSSRHGPLASPDANGNEHDRWQAWLLETLGR